jgi:hypothetical protein
LRGTVEKARERLRGGVEELGFLAVLRVILYAEGKPEWSPRRRRRSRSGRGRCALLNANHGVFLASRRGEDEIAELEFNGIQRWS